MATLKERVDQDLKEPMRQKQELKTSVLRMSMDELRHGGSLPLLGATLP